MTTNGLTSNDIKSFLEFLVKANNSQLEALRKQINSEINKREVMKK